MGIVFITSNILPIENQNLTLSDCLSLAVCLSKTSMIALFLSLLLLPKPNSASEIELIRANSTISSANKTFELGFFSANNNQKWYLGIWYGSIPIPTYVWVANRDSPAGALPSAAAVITCAGKLAVRDGERTVWETDNADVAEAARLTEEGALELVAGERVVWRSFDFPGDTWLPGMNMSGSQSLICWRSLGDPAPGRFSVRLKPPEFGQIELVYGGNWSYWSTGNWTGNEFSGVPEMTIPYIYRFHFTHPFTPDASFGYIETSLERGVRPPLTRFQLDSFGQLRQYTWSSQIENWNMFWSQPESLCRVYGLCGNLGFCNMKMLNPCKCLGSFEPVDTASWDSGDFSGGCRRFGGTVCSSNDVFEEVGLLSFDGAVIDSFSRSRDACEMSCLNNCSCIGLFHNDRTSTCKNIHGTVLNLRNSTSDTSIDGMLYLRVSRGRVPKKNQEKTLVLVVIICVFLVLSTVITVAVMFLRRSRIKKQKEEEEAIFPVTNLKVFTYKELSAATRGFSEMLGHGGFGAVFSGKLSDSSLVAVKRLERPGGAEREFRAEVRTIGNIQHVNLMRLRGFCSENSHKLLVYDYMPNGPLSMYLKRDGPGLSWDVRFRVAISTARALSYLHEGCRDCIIHCDIKPENILLDKDFSPKVSDFGLAKLIGRDFSRVLASMRGTWGYVAPEWISGVAITSKADVYSYGMTMLELIGGRRNVEGPPSVKGGGGTGEKWFFPPWAAQRVIEGNVAAIVDERLGGEYEVMEAQRLGLVAVWCIQDEEAMRPTMGMVVKMLEGVVEVGVPPPPMLIQALVSGESFHGVMVDSAKTESTSGGFSIGNIRVSEMSIDFPDLVPNAG